MDIYQHNFKKLIQLLPNLKTLPDAIKLKAPSYMDLGVEVQERHELKRVIALSHYYKHPSGDMMPAPDMTMAVYFSNEMADAMHQ